MPKTALRNQPNPFLEVEPSVSVDVVYLTSRGRLSLPAAVRNRLAAGDRSGPSLMLVTVIGEGTVRLEAWSPKADELVAAITEQAALLEGPDRANLLALAIERWSRVLLQEDGRIILPPLVALRVDVESGIPLRVVTESGRSTLYTPNAWQELLGKAGPLLDALGHV